MKKDITKFVSMNLTCQQVKCKHQRPGSEFERTLIPIWKCE